MSTESEGVRSLDHLATASHMLAELLRGTSEPPNDATVRMLAHVFEITPDQVREAAAATAGET